MMQELKISTERRPRKDLERQGYACFKGSDLSVPHDLERELSLLRQDYEALPPDQYCESGNRYRRHSRYVLLPWPKKRLRTAAATLFTGRKGPTVGDSTGISGTPICRCPLPRPSQANNSQGCVSANSLSPPP